VTGRRGAGERRRRDRDVECQFAQRNPVLRLMFDGFTTPYTAKIPLRSPVA